MSNPTKPAIGSPEDWLEHARSDLRYARLGASDPDVLPNQVAFHAQQAAEKALKAALVRRAISFPKTHDLIELVHRWTTAGPSWPQHLTGITTLNPYAVETRYPGYVQQVSKAEVQTAILNAEQVLAWAEGIVNSPPPAPQASTGGAGN